MKDEPLHGEVTRRRRNAGHTTHSLCTGHSSRYFIALFLRIFFLTWTIFKVFMNPLQYCFCFMLWFFFGHEAGRILTHWPGMEPTCPVLEAKSLNHWTTREVSQALFLELRPNCSRPPWATLSWLCKPGGRSSPGLQCLSFPVYEMGARTVLPPIVCALEQLWGFKELTSKVLTSESGT